MLNSRLLEVYSTLMTYLSVGSLVIFIFFFELSFIFFFDLDIISCYFIEYKIYNVWIYSIDYILDIKLIGELLINHYFLFLFIAGIVLLLALVGAIELTYKTTYLNLLDYNTTRYSYNNKIFNKSYGLL
jgi:NADH:ubiquinone oxidoreductase subunit 6 (subunit J)